MPKTIKRPDVGSAEPSSKEGKAAAEAAASKASVLEGNFGVQTDVLIRRLAELGWLGDGDSSQERIADALANTNERELRRALLGYQHFHGLSADSGLPDPETQRSLSDPRFCGLPDVMPIQTSLSRWANPTITWTLYGNAWPGVGMDGAREAFALAWQQWAVVCGIKPVYTPNVKTANVVTSPGQIDGPMGVLAYSELPATSNWTGPSKQLFDQGEAWTNGEDPPRYQIDLVRVACHEIGHVLGLPHIAAGNLLQPTYDVRIRKPQAGDIQEVLARYGPPLADTQPPPSTGKATITIELQGGQIVSASIPGFRVSRLVG